MSDPMMDGYGSHETDQEDWENEDQEPRVLWGRVVGLGVVVVLAFLIGRASSGGGVPAGDFTRVQEKATDLEAENEDLRTQVALLETEGSDGAALPAEGSTGTDGEAEGEGAGEGQDQAVEGLTYVVKKGDNLSRIAKKFYDDGSLGRFLARANNISNPANLSVGQKLVIPDRG